MTMGMPSMHVEPDITKPGLATTRRRHAISNFLLRHPALLLPLSSTFVDALPLFFESSIRGPSMEPVIPAGSRLRVQVGQPQLCQPGDVVFYLTDDGYMVHRIVHKPRRGAHQDYLLTCGDHRLAPDPPVHYTQLLGTVMALQREGTWHPLGPPRPGPLAKRVLRAVTLLLMCLVLHCSARTACGLAKRLLQLELRGRMSVRYWQRRRFQGESER